MLKRIQIVIKANFSLFLSLAFLLAWLFEIRFTSLLFFDTSQVLYSSFFSLSAAGAVLLCLLFVRPSFFDFLKRRSVAVVTGSVMTIFAVVLTLLPNWPNAPADATGDAPFIFAGILFGVVFFGIILWGISIYKHYQLMNAWQILIPSLAAALLIIVIVNRLMPRQNGYLSAALPCLSFCFSLLGFRYKGKDGVDEKSSNILTCPSKPFLLKLLLFFTGFFVVYMPTMFPKTTNLTASYFADFNWGGINYVSLGALALFMAFCVLILWYIGGNTIGAPIIAFLVTAVFAFAFYFMSLMNTNNLAFLIIMPCSMIFVLWACAIFLATVNLNQPEGVRALRMGLAWLFSGGFFAAVFSTLFLGPFFGAVEYQDTIIVLITGSVFIIIIALFVGIRSDFVSLFFPEILFREKLDSSSLENRCRLMGVHYKLTGREVQVLMLLAEGRNEPYIAELLTVSRATVKTHIQHIYQKISVSSRQELLDLLHSS